MKKQKKQKYEKLQAIQVSRENSLRHRMKIFSDRHRMKIFSDLPYDILIKIAKLLKTLEDFVSFRCVSKSFREAVKYKYFEGIRLRQKIPYLMIPTRDDNNDDIRGFYSLIKGESIVASFKVPKFKSMKCLESLGWLLISDRDGRMSLIDPFSDIQIFLPHQNTFPHYGMFSTYRYMRKMVLSSRPNENSDFILMVIGREYGHLAYWRPGDIAWNMIETRIAWGYTDVVYNGDGQFYAVCSPGIIYAFNLIGNNPKVGRKIASCEAIGLANRMYICKTIVENSLLLIFRTSHKKRQYGLSYITAKFQVYEIDTISGTFKRIRSLGTLAVFLGHNSTFFIDTYTFSGQVINANHIYFTDDDWELYSHDGFKGSGMDIGVYNLKTETIEPIYPGESLYNKVSPSFWITPYF